MSFIHVVASNAFTRFSIPVIPFLFIPRALFPVSHTHTHTHSLVEVLGEDEVWRGAGQRGDASDI